MPAAPRAANGSPPESRAQAADLSRLSASRRLRNPAQFQAVNTDPLALRASRRWLAIAGSVHAGAGHAPLVRFGFTAARRHARRAVERNTVKRVLREAARQRLGDLDAAAADRAVDIVLRLRAPVPPTRALAEWKRALRLEADALLGELSARLRRSGTRP